MPLSLTTQVLIPAATGVAAWLGVYRLRTYLHPLQQEEYDTARFFTWYREKKALDRWVSVGLLMAVSLTTWPVPQAPAMAMGFSLLWLGWRLAQEPNPTKPTPTTKKPLVLTPRANLIGTLAAALTVPLLVAAFTLPKVVEAKILFLILFFQLLPFVLMVANLLVWPLQHRENQRYLKECTTILQRLSPTIVGITGSFGKTSTKYILNHLLSAQGPTLMTPGSVNTPLGIARIVREQLQPHHAMFLAEMGAYGPGSIAGLCQLAPPTVSCITAVGEAHYERFRTLETVAAAKFEVATATHANGGVCVLNIDGIAPQFWQTRVAETPAGYILVGRNSTLLRPQDVHLKHVDETPTGLALTLTTQGETFTFTTPVYGQAQAGNVAVAFAMARQLGLKPAAIVKSMATIPAAPHRLNVQHTGTATLIDDSYNANPLGFRTALETLTLIAHAATPHRRRVLVTPGMVELGALHDAAHTQAAQTAMAHADVIVAIGPKRIPTFVETVHETQRSGLYRGQLVPVETLAAAKSWLATHGKPTDVTLIENDLPDRYESRWPL